MRRFLTIAGLTLAASFNLAACGQYVQSANLGRCTALPASGGSLCEEIGGDYIFVDGMTRSMQRVSAPQAQLITQLNGAFAAAQPAPGGAAGGQRNCLANPSIACSGALNNRVTGYRSGGYSGVCSGGQCLSMGR